MNREEFILAMKEAEFTDEEIKEELEIADEMRGEKELEDYSPFFPIMQSIR